MCIKRWPQKLNPSLLNKRTFDARNDFGSVFELLLGARALGEHSAGENSSILENRLSSELQVLIQSKSELLHGLPRDEKYSRHIIGTEGDWIGYICRWEKQTSSSIHGHPSFAYYQVIEGEFQMDLYDSTGDDTATRTQSLIMARGDIIWKQGQEGTYDNLIHKVGTLDSPGFTLHLFSEDPNQGQCYLS